MEPEATDHTPAMFLCTPRAPDGLARFATTYCKTLDERGQVRPLLRWPYVLEMLRALETGGDLHIEKSRQMGGSWILAACFLWRLLFVPGSALFLGSRKEALVDDGGLASTPASLFGRIRFMYDRLPEWMREAMPVRFAFLRVECKASGSFLTGEATNGQAGRGGSFSMAAIDEAALIERSEGTHRAIRPACPRGLVYLSTPNGRANTFARIRSLRPDGWRFLRLHWTRHPERWDGLERDPETGKPTSEWYRRLCADLTTDAIARELEIDYSQSVAGLVYPEFSIERHVRPIPYDADLPLLIGLDPGIGAPTAACIAQHLGPELRILRDYELRNAPGAVHAANLWAQCQELGFKGTPRDVRLYMDPAANAREMVTGSTVAREYQRFGFVVVTPRHPIRDGVRATRNKFHRGEIFVSDRCTEIPDRISDYKYPTSDSGSVMGDTPDKRGDASHVMDALRYLVTGLFALDPTPEMKREHPANEPVSHWFMPGDRDYARLRAGKTIMHYPARF